MLETITAAFWTEARPEQRRLTIQLIRNTSYFAAAVYLIRNFSDRFAI